eukprot:s6496_g4.t1
MEDDPQLQVGLDWQPHTKLLARAGPVHRNALQSVWQGALRADNKGKAWCSPCGCEATAKHVLWDCQWWQDNFPEPEVFQRWRREYPYPSLWTRGLVPRVTKPDDNMPVVTTGLWQDGGVIEDATVLYATDGSPGAGNDPRLHYHTWAALAYRVDGGNIVPVATAAGPVQGQQSVYRSEVSALAFVCARARGTLDVTTDCKSMCAPVQRGKTPPESADLLEPILEESARLHLVWVKSHLTEEQFRAKPVTEAPKRKPPPPPAGKRTGVKKEDKDALGEVHPPQQAEAAAAVGDPAPPATATKGKRKRAEKPGRILPPLAADAWQLLAPSNMAQYRGAVLSPKDLVSLGNEPFKCGLVGMVEDLPSPMNVVRALPQAMAALLPPGLYAGLDLLGRGRTRAAYTLGKALVVKVGFPHHFGEETEIMQMLPLLSAELLGEGTVATRLVLNTEPLVNMMVPLRYSISARATNMVQYAQNQEMAPGWQGYATAVILCLASRFTLRDITSSNVALDFTACRANCPNIVFFDMADWVKNPTEGPISWPAKYTWKGWESIMDQVGTEYSEQYKPLMKRAGSMEKALDALLAVLPGKMLRKLELQDCISKRGDRYQLDLKLRERQ